jgi:hypothetical protein
MHQHRVLHWTDGKLSIDWKDVAGVVVELGLRIGGRGLKRRAPS